MLLQGGGNGATAIFMEHGANSGAGVAYKGKGVGNNSRTIGTDLSHRQGGIGRVIAAEPQLATLYTLQVVQTRITELQKTVETLIWREQNLRGLEMSLGLVPNESRYFPL